MHSNRSNQHNLLFKEVTKPPINVEQLRKRLHKSLRHEFKLVAPEVFNFIIDDHITSESNINEMFKGLKEENIAQNLILTPEEIQTALVIALEDHAKACLNNAYFVKCISEIILNVKLKNAMENVPGNSI